MRRTALACALAALLAAPPAAAPAQTRARDVVSELTAIHPDRVLTEIVVRRSEAGATPEQRIARLHTALAAYDRATAEAVADHPRHQRIVYRRASLLRSLGRNAEAVALLTPFLADLRQTATESYFGIWLIDEAATALSALGRDDEAIALMSRLTVLDYGRRRELLGPSINYAALLWNARRPAEALAHLETIMWQAQRGASGTGWMWIASTRVCALRSLQRNAAAAELIEAMHARRMETPGAMMRALLCANDIERAEAFLVERLDSSDRVWALIALQDYRLGNGGTGLNAVLFERLAELRERPAVRAAIDRVGIVLPLPLARTYYGNL